MRILNGICAIILPALLSAILSWLLNQYSPLVSTNWPLSLVFLITLTGILHLVYAFQTNSENFTQLLLGAIVVKLLLALGLVMIYKIRDYADFFNFSIQFILHYILFMIFEIRYLLRILKTQLPKQN